jgi:hypothetical protein
MGSQASPLRLSVNLDPKEFYVVFGGLLTALALIVFAVYRPEKGTRNKKKTGGATYGKAPQSSEGRRTNFSPKTGAVFWVLVLLAVLTSFWWVPAL